jgi:transposase-like protein
MESMARKQELEAPAWTGAEPTEGERSEAEGGGAQAHAAAVGDTEVRARAKRRRFTAEYKTRVLREADGCRKPGELGALLRREGLYSSHLVTWRRERELAALQALRPKKRGPKGPSAETRRIEELEREIVKLREELRRARLINEAQKKLHELLGIPVAEPSGEETK